MKFGVQLDKFYNIKLKFVKCIDDKEGCELTMWRKYVFDFER